MNVFVEYKLDRLPAFATRTVTGAINLGHRTESNDSGISVKSTFSTTNTEEVSIIFSKKKVTFLPTVTCQKRFDETPDTFRPIAQRKALFQCFPRANF